MIFHSVYFGVNIWRNPVNGMYSILGLEFGKGQFAADTLGGIKQFIRELREGLDSSEKNVVK